MHALWLLAALFFSIALPSEADASYRCRITVDAWCAEPVELWGRPDGPYEVKSLVACGAPQETIRALELTRIIDGNLALIQQSEAGLNVLGNDGVSTSSARRLANQAKEELRFFVDEMAFCYLKAWVWPVVKDEVTELVEMQKWSHAPIIVEWGPAGTLKGLRARLWFVQADFGDPRLRELAKESFERQKAECIADPAKSTERCDAMVAPNAYVRSAYYAVLEELPQNDTPVADRAGVPPKS